jgi:heptosyltransferase II
MAGTQCRHFNGYKPCGKVDSLQSSCSTVCAKFEMSGPRVLLVHLGALGAVVRSTALLPAIVRMYPGAHITWVTEAPGDLLLREHPLIDRVVVANADGALELSALEFDVALVVDKSLKATGLLRQTTATEVRGYIVNAKTGGIEPATEAAKESWRLGLSNHEKFFVNRKTETQLVHEALELGPWMRDQYALFLNEKEAREAQRRRALWSSEIRGSLIGINTGCANTIAYKKLSIAGHVELISQLRAHVPSSSIVLLGGKEDTARNQTIAAQARAKGFSVIESSTEHGLRDGMISVAACDAILTGDSLGMHMALGFSKPVVAWFGPTCAHEVDLYGGIAVLTKSACSPCWKRSCEKSAMCYDQVDFVEMAAAVQSLLTSCGTKMTQPAPRLENTAEL